MDDEDAVLDANEAFYQAFASRDVGAMDEIWARGASVACIHPGWHVLTGRERVMASWVAILQNSDSPAIQCQDPEVFLHGDLAFVVCYEVIGEDFLIATNIFIREDGAWRMLHHHACPTTGPSPDEEPEPPDGEAEEPEEEPPPTLH